MMAVEGLVVESSDSPSKPEDYVVVNGYRLVKPYHFDFRCNVRQRWFGQNIVDVFTREFPARDRAYYQQALADGRLRVEGRAVGPDTPLRDGDCMRHFIHRHEPPVPAGPVQVVEETADIVAVSKPPGMPVHVAGQYRKNTVLGVLTAERPDLGALLPVHRLDKPVSGLLLFARSSASAEALRQKIEGRTVEKVYVARVLGAFPASEQPIVVDVPLAWDPEANHASAVQPPPAEQQQPEPEQQRGEQQQPDAGCSAAAAAAMGLRVGAGAGAGTESGAQAPAAPAADLEQQLQVQTAEAAAEAQKPEGAHLVDGGAEGACGQQAPLANEPQPAQAQQQVAQQAQQRPSRKERRAAKRERRAAAGAAAGVGGTGRDARREAKPALTEFRLLWVAPDGQTSLVECRPRTGRTHQIRVHLQYLGYPIANDTQYGGQYGGPLASRVMARDLGVSWDRQRQAAAEEQQQQQQAAAEQQQQQQQGKGPDGSTAGQQGAAGSTADYNGEEGCAAKRARTDPGASQAAGVASQEQHQQAKEAAELCEDPHSQRCPAAAPSGGGSGGGERSSSSGGGGPAGADGAADQAQPEGDAYAQNQAFRSSPEYQAPAALHDPLCPHCPYYAPRDYPLDLRPLWLHARCYSCAEGEWSFSAGLPEWAARDYVPQR